VHNLEEWQGQQFFTMEYITGRSLHELIAERKSQIPPFSLSEAAAIITPVLDALAYAHEHTIHRDIKPDNIIVIGDFPDATAKVLDFGIAKALSTSSFTQTAQALGTAFYMAPEQMSGSDIDRRADLYSTGMVLYEMLTGEMAVGRFQLPGEIYSKMPKAIDEMLEKSLAKEREDRYDTAGEMAQALQAAATSWSGAYENAGWLQKPIQEPTPSDLEQQKAKAATIKRWPPTVVKKRFSKGALIFGAIFIIHGIAMLLNKPPPEKESIIALVEIGMGTSLFLRSFRPPVGWLRGLTVLSGGALLTNMIMRFIWWPWKQSTGLGIKFLILCLSIFLLWVGFKPLKKTDRKTKRKNRKSLLK
jgi:serine/threonine protein kinase